MLPKIKFRVNPWQIYLLTGIVGAIVTTTLIHHFQAINRANLIHTPLFNAIKEIQLEAGTAHAWFADALASHHQTDPREVWGNLEQSAWYLRTLLEERQRTERTQTLFDFEALRLKAMGIQQQVTALIETCQRWNDSQASFASPTAFEQAYEALFTEIIDRAWLLEGDLREMISGRQRRFRRTEIGLIVTCVLLFALIGLMFHRFQGHKRQDENRLNALINKLHQEIQRRKRTEADLREAKERFETFFRTSPDAMLITRLTDGHCVDINSGFIESSGYCRKEVVGRSIIELGLWENPASREKLLKDLSTQTQVANFETLFRRKDGRCFTGQVSARRFNLGDEPHILSAVRNIDQIKAAERQLAASHQFLKVSNQHTEIQPLLGDFIAETRAFTGCSAAGIRILDGNGNIPYQVYEGFSREFMELENPLSIHQHPCMCTAVIRNEAPPGVPCFTSHGSFFTGSTTRLLVTLSEAEKGATRNVCNQMGYESVGLIPIRSGDQVIGLIHFADRQPDRVHPENVKMIEGAALHLATAIRRVQAEEDLRRYRDELEERVRKRTAQLQNSNLQLAQKVKEHQRAEKELILHQARLRTLSAELLLTEERERRRIATEIHDHIGQSLAACKLKLLNLRDWKAAPEFRQNIDALLGLTNQTIQDTRTLTFELSPPILYELGLAPALEWLAEKNQEQHGLAVAVHDDGQPKPLSESVRIFIFQVVRELLFNVVKHARATRATLSLQRVNRSLHVEVADDGAGFAPGAFELFRAGKGEGFGLFSIRERLRHHGGYLVVDSEPGRGTRATLVSPLQSEGENVKEDMTE